jgi:hypothetical protein
MICTSKGYANKEEKLFHRESSLLRQCASEQQLSMKKMAI